MCTHRPFGNSRCFQCRNLSHSIPCLTQTRISQELQKGKQVFFDNRTSNHQRNCRRKPQLHTTSATPSCLSGSSSRSTSSAEQSPDESAKAHFQWRPSQMHAENTLACEKFRRLSNVCCIFIGQHFVAVDCLLPVGCGSLLDTWASSSGSTKGCTQQGAAASISHLLPLSHLGSHQRFHFAVLQGCEQMCTHRPFGNSRCFQCRNLSHSIPCLTQTRISQELQKGKQIFFDNRTSNHQRNCRRKPELHTTSATPSCLSSSSSRSTSSAEQSPDESAKAHFQWRPSQMHAENTLACEKFRRLSNVCCIFIGQHFVAVDCLLPVGCGSLLDTWASSSGSRKGCTQQGAAASISHLLPLSHLGSHQRFHFAVLQGCEQMCTHRPFRNNHGVRCRNLSHSIPCLTQTRISQELQKGKQIFFDNRTSNHQRNCRRKSQLHTSATPSCLSGSSSRSTSSAEQSPDESAKAHFQWRPSQMHAENTLACEKFRRLSNVCCIFIGQHFVAVDCLLPVGCGSLLDTWASSSGSRKGCTQQGAAASISHLLPLSHLGSHQRFHFAVLQGCEQMCTHRPFGNSQCFQCRNLRMGIKIQSNICI